jgi:hypothetical protein
MGPGKRPSANPRLQKPSGPREPSRSRSVSVNELPPSDHTECASPASETPEDQTHDIIDHPRATSETSEDHRDDFDHVEFSRTPEAQARDIDMSDSDSFAKNGFALCEDVNMSDPLTEIDTLPAPSSSTCSTPTKSGRLPTPKRKFLEEKFGTIDAIFASLADSLGFTTERVIALWNKFNGRRSKGFNYWNIYESYLAANLSDELARSGFDFPPGIKWDEISHKQRRICYASFQKDYPDDGWEEILQVFDMSRKCERSVGTFAKRTANFQKLSAQLVGLASASLNRSDNTLTSDVDGHVAS